MRRKPAKTAKMWADPDQHAPLHRRLGIATKTHLQAVTDYKGGFNRATGEYWSPHLFRVAVTLPRIA